MVAFRFAPLAFLVAFAAEPALAEPCRGETFKDNAYIVCSFDLAKTDLRLFWRNADGAPFGTFTALAGYLAAEGDTLQFAMNGGMYDEDYRPMGLYVEGGKELSPVKQPIRRRRSDRFRTSSRSPTGCSISERPAPACSPPKRSLPPGRKPTSPPSPARCW